MTRRVLVALFDSPADAERAVAALGGLALRAPGVAVQQGDVALPEQAPAIWQDGLRRGGALLRAEVPEDALDLALDAMEAAGALDLTTRAGTTPATAPRSMHEHDVMGEGARRPVERPAHRGTRRGGAA